MGLQVLGLWGMGGIGKTALAAKLFNSLLPSFGDAACFLGNVRTEATHAGGIVKLQQDLLRALTGSHISINNVGTGALLIGVRICSLMTCIMSGLLLSSCRIDYTHQFNPVCCYVTLMPF